MSMLTERDPLLGRASHQNGDDGKQTEEPGIGPLEISRSTRRGILAGTFLANFLSALNTTLVPTMLPAISSDFNRANQGSWLGTSFLLATCTFTPLYGRLCNALGRKGAIQLAMVFAALGNLACGLSGSMEMLIAARFLGGMGGGGMITSSQIIANDMYSIRERGLLQGIASIFTGLGLGLGGPVGGIITDWFGWRWAFLFQLPIFALSFVFIESNLNYVTPGKGKNTIEILKRIDWCGMATLLFTVGSILVFLSTRYNEGRPWADPAVYVSAILGIVFFVSFLLVELFVSPEPVLAPSLLKQRIPALVGISNYLVGTCNFSVIYFFPMWFQTVGLTSASTAGLHLLPNSVSMALGSLFAGWMMHRTGKYKTINLIFGLFPFIGTLLILQIREDSGWWQMWFSVIPLGFGNAVVLQTVLIALLVHLPSSAMAVGTGFSQLFRGVGQVSGVAISSAIFQSILDRELHLRIHGPDAAEMIDKIRHSATLVAKLPPDLQRAARDSYAVGLHAVFMFASCFTFLSYLVRLPIPDKKLEHATPSPLPTTTTSDADFEERAATGPVPVVAAMK